LKGINGKGRPYAIALYGTSSGITLIPSCCVQNSEYRPSGGIEEQIMEMWNHRRPRAVGSVSELMAKEILDSGQVIADGLTWTLECKKLRNLKEISGNWRPSRGIYCDDLVAIAESAGKRQLFLAEVKGTTLGLGLSHSMEAIIFYQLARTCVRLGQMMPARGYFPDGWLYPCCPKYCWANDLC
jgi:hypothetical protein